MMAETSNARGEAGAWAVPPARLAEMAKRIARRVRPLQLILFGSQARGDSHRWSDADFLVVVADSRDTGQVRDEIEAAVGKLQLRCDAFVATSSEVRRRGNLVGDVLRPALREGRVLYDADLGLGDFGRPDLVKLEVAPVTESERRAATEDWLDNATGDLETAELAIERDRLAGIVCFHAQQAAEKALKAVLVYVQIDYPFTHDLDDARNRIPDDWRVKRDFPDLKWLAAWAVKGRYAARRVSPEEARRALDQARAIYDGVLRDLEAHGFAREEHP